MDAALVVEFLLKETIQLSTSPGTTMMTEGAAEKGPTSVPELERRRSKGGPLTSKHDR